MRVIFLFLLLASPLTGLEEVWKGEQAPGFSVKISRSSTPVSIDGLLQVVVEARYPQGYKLNKALLRSHLIDYPGYGAAPFSLASEESIMLSPGNEKITYLLDPDIPGHYALTFRDIMFEEEKTKESIRMLTGVFDVDVTMPSTLTMAEGTPFGLLPLTVDLPLQVDAGVRAQFFDNPSWISWVRLRGWQEFRRSLFPWKSVSALLILLGASFGVSVLLRRRQPVLTRETVRVRAQREAQQALEAIHSMALPQAGEYDQYYVLLTGVVRKYLETAYSLQAKTLTTEEFLLQVVSHPSLNASERELLKKFLESADKVKFAKYKPTGLECAYAETAAADLINQSFGFIHK